MNLTRFISIWTIIFISISLLLVQFQIIQDTNSPASLTLSPTKGHFSVRWMGFLPSYSSQYPDYCVCINNLAGDPWTMGIGFQIKNQEDKGYFFQIGPNSTPPAGWVLQTYNLSFIAIDQALTFTYNASRSKIASITQGESVELIPMVVKAFNDSVLTQLYSQDSFNITFRFIDYASTYWSTLYHDSFDDKTTQGWAANGGAGPTISASNDYYRSYPYSLKINPNTYYSGLWYDVALRKSVVVPSGYSVAYLIFSIRSTNYPTNGIRIHYGTQYFGTSSSPQTNSWYQFAMPIPIGQTTTVDIYAAYGQSSPQQFAYFDDVYVIAK